MMLDDRPGWQVFAGVLVVQYLRYLLIVGFTHWLLYAALRRWTTSRRVSIKGAGRRDMWREAKASFWFIATLSVPVAFFVMPAHRGYTKFYVDASAHPWWWLPVTFALLMFGQDTYFYWTHRLLHRRSIFKVVHALHHRSLHPTAFAAFAMHPLEAVALMGFNLVFVLSVPTHLGVFAAYQVVSFALNVAGHCGVDVFPDSWARWPVLRHLNRPRAHAAHHKLYDVNFGLYFTSWDRWMGTFDDRARPIDAAPRTTRALAGSVKDEPPVRAA